MMSIQGRNRKRRVFPDDESDNDSTTAAGDAAAAVGVRRATRSRSSDEDDESSLPPLLCTDQARSEGAVGSQAGQARTERKEGKKERGSCDGFRHREAESGVEFSGDDGAQVVDGEEDETDEELAGRAGACGTLEEEDVDTDEEIGTSTWDRTGHRRQPEEEDGEIDPDADGIGKGIDNRADDVVGSSPPAVDEMPSKKVQQVEPNSERATTDGLENDDEESARSSVDEGNRTRGAGAVQGDFAPPSPVLQAPPTIQVKLWSWQAGREVAS